MSFQAELNWKNSDIGTATSNDNSRLPKIVIRETVILLWFRVRLPTSTLFPCMDLSQPRGGGENESEKFSSLAFPFHERADKANLLLTVAPSLAHFSSAPCLSVRAARTPTG